jgi:endopolyphosphatase
VLKALAMASRCHLTPGQSGCDSPFALSNFTLDFLDEHWASEIDFVICELSLITFFKGVKPRHLGTGDNARHDNDGKLPRTTKEIYDLNHVVATKMEEVFVRKGIPVVPSLGKVLRSSSCGVLTGSTFCRQQ